MFVHYLGKQNQQNIGGFYVRKQLLLSARLNYHNSIYLSVRLSHGWINQKRCKLESPYLHLRLRILVSGTVKFSRKFEGSYPERVRQLRGGWAKFAIFGQ